MHLSKSRNNVFNGYLELPKPSKFYYHLQEHIYKNQICINMQAQKLNIVTGWMFY